MGKFEKSVKEKASVPLYDYRDLFEISLIQQGNYSHKFL